VSRASGGPAAARITVDADREEAELARYLGGDFSRDKLTGHQHRLDAEFAAVGGDEDTFYRSSEAYLYDLTVFAMTATKVPYLQTLVDLLPPGARVLDYGCGIGSDGLLLLDSGYHVEFADFDNPSTTYLRWRLAQRALQAAVHDVDRSVPGGFDAAYAFDVIEHVRDPFGLLAQLETRADLVMVNLLEFDSHEQDLHHPLAIDELVAHAADRDLVSYQLLHGSSHLIAYRPRLVGAAARLRNRGRIAAGRARSRALARAR
jgi:hypothetical protein